MKEFLAITKALADENRVRGLLALAGGELCVCQIIELLELAPSTVSKHMAILQDAGLVESRKQGRWIYYRLPEAPESPCARSILAVAMDCLRGDRRIREDARRIKRIRRMDRVELCARYHT